jgi:hypothetical protein
MQCLMLNFSITQSYIPSNFSGIRNNFHTISEGFFFAVNAFTGVIKLFDFCNSCYT